MGTLLLPGKWGSSKPADLKDGYSITYRDSRMRGRTTMATRGQVMRNAALMLGIIGGLIAMLVGFFGFGYTELVREHSQVGEMFGHVDNPLLIRITSFAAPLLAIAGGAMAKMRALLGGILMLLAGVLMYFAFGFNAFTMLPIGFCVVGGLLAIAAGKPDEPKAHF